MTPILKNQIIDHAAACYPRECCGLLVNINGVPTYYPCKNMAAGTDHFILKPEDYAAADALGAIIAVVHSHPDCSPEPSEADRVVCEATNLPWHIVRYPDPAWAYLEPIGYKAPLIGRQWAHGVLDCYTLIQDWYREEQGITLPHFTRADDWWYKGENLYLENFAKAGFVSVGDVQPQVGDVLLMQILADVPNHGAIYLGNDTILHHLHGRLSTREVWAGYYRKHTTHVLRYQA